MQLDQCHSSAARLPPFHVLSHPCLRQCDPSNVYCSKHSAGQDDRMKLVVLRLLFPMYHDRQSPFFRNHFLHHPHKARVEVEETECWVGRSGISTRSASCFLSFSFICVGSGLSSYPIHLCLAPYLLYGQRRQQGRAERGYFVFTTTDPRLSRYRNWESSFGLCSVQRHLGYNDLLGPT